MKKAIVLLNMGGPNGLDEVEIFLTNMFNDKNIITVKSNLLRKFIAYMITKFRLNEAKKNYKLLGGVSPIIAHTKKLIEELAHDTLIDVFIYSMRYTYPFASDTIKILKEKKIEKVFLLPLYAQYSSTTTKSSLEDFYEKSKELNFSPKFTEIQRFYKNRLYNEAIIENIEKSIKDIDYKNYIMIFSAHSLPQKIIDNGDSYQDEIIENVEILKKILKERDIHFKEVKIAYQSKLGPVKWLEPSLESSLEGIKGEKMVIIYPISFIIDNSESEFELDIEYREVAKNLNFKDYRVVKCLNSSPKFISCIRELTKDF